MADVKQEPAPPKSRCTCWYHPAAPKPRNADCPEHGVNRPGQGKHAQHEAVVMANEAIRRENAAREGQALDEWKPWPSPDGSCPDDHHRQHHEKMADNLACSDTVDCTCYYCAAVRCEERERVLREIEAKMEIASAIHGTSCWEPSLRETIRRLREGP